MGCKTKLVLIGIFLSVASTAYAQKVIIDEDFSDGDFAYNPVWTDSESKHIINASNRLQLDALSESAEAVISTSSTAAYGEWEIFIQLGFNPSSSNLSRIYLIANNQDMKGAIDGYFIQIGNTDDEVSLYRQDGNSTTKIIDGSDDLIATNPVTIRIRVTRNIEGTWELFVDPTGSTSYTSQGTATDNSYTQSNYIGLLSDYTSTRSDLFEYDDIKVTKIIPPLDIQSITVADNQTIHTSFNLDVDPSSIQTSDFIITPDIGNPDNINTSGNLVQLMYNESIPGGKYTLTVNDIEDSEGNIIDPNTNFQFQFFDSFVRGDLIINEFTYDYPTTINEEYIEIKNTSRKYLNLADWKIADNNSSSSLGSEPIPIEPDSFLVISADTSELYNLFGNRAYHQVSFPALNNTTPDAVQLITNGGTKADSLTYNSDWGGTDVSLERRSTSSPSIYKENWGNSPSTNGGTPGTSNEIAPDIKPPELKKLTILSEQTIQLAYDERLNQAGSYSITNNSIALASQTAADTVELLLDSNLQNAQEYTLSIENASDIFGNIIAPIDTSFSYYNPSPVDSGDIAINEFMYAPPSGTTEYIELYNHSKKSLNLQGWTLRDNRENFEATISNDQFIIPPDSFAVIAPDNTIKSKYPSVALVAMSDFPALNNGGDEIIIRDQNSTLLDSLSYTSDWGGDEVAVERHSIDISGTYQVNWGNNPNGFGTPGSQNKITQDQTPPSLEEIVTVDKNKIKLTFSEKISPSSATNKDHYQLSPSINIQLISVQNNIVTLFLEQNLTDTQTYQVTVSNISDIFGNALSSDTQSLKYLQIDKAQYREIVINEILYNPGTEQKADFIELLNTTNKNFDLTGWIIGDYSTQTTIKTSLQLQAGEYVVLTGNSNYASGLSNGITISGFPSLNNNTPDNIYLKNKNGLKIDSLRYSQNWGRNTDGYSLERKDPQGASNDPSNWQTNRSDEGITAGNQNTSFREDTTPPKVVFSKTLEDGTFEVRFNEFISLTSKVAFFTNDQQLSVSGFDSTNANFIVLKSPAAKTIAKRNDITLRIENLSDIKGNITPNAKIPVAQKMQQGDLVINEIMFNPLADSDDNLPDQTEYIELRNTQDHALSLEGLYLHDEPDESGEIRDIQPVSTTAKWVPPQGYVLVHADKATNFDESLTASFFDLKSPNSQSIIRSDRSSLSLASSNDAIYIADSTGTTIDSVFYDKSWHNPNIIDTRGIALERISPTGNSNDKSNWGSSVTEKGGTPHGVNSIFQENTEITAETGISFEPNPFSPDNNGYEDNLFISYKLKQKDYLMKVRIYDRYGRHVRTLADGDQAGFEGQLIWDGRKDDRSRNRIGIYIVIFEAYDSASGDDKTFKRTVVLARQLN